MTDTEAIVHLIKPSGKGGMTIIANHRIGDSYITLRTAICSDADQFNRKHGVFYARTRGEIKFPVQCQSWRKQGTNPHELRMWVLNIFESAFMETVVWG